MAVYAVSLRQLRARRTAPPPRDAAPLQPEPQSAVAGAPSAPTPPAPEPSAESAKLADALSSSVEELLSLPRSELEALLAQSGAASSKVLLSLIYRLGTLERQLGALGSRVRPASVSAPRPSGAAIPPVNFSGAAKSDLLEQVFRKNLSLRQGDGA